jgi:hypothetical protein
MACCSPSSSNLPRCLRSYFPGFSRHDSLVLNSMTSKVTFGNMFATGIAENLFGVHLQVSLVVSRLRDLSKPTRQFHCICCINSSNWDLLICICLFFLVFVATSSGLGRSCRASLMFRQNKVVTFAWNILWWLWPMLIDLGIRYTCAVHNRATRNTPISKICVSMFMCFIHFNCQRIVLTCARIDLKS